MTEQIILLLAIAISVYGFIQPVAQRLKLVAQVKKGPALDQPVRRLMRVITEVLFQSKVIAERPFAGLMHALVFWGFIAFVPVTLDHFARGFGGTILGHGALRTWLTWIVVPLAITVIIGITALLIRRFVTRPASLGAVKAESGVVALLIELLMVTYLLDLYLFDDHTALAAQVNWWVHTLSILSFMWLIPRSKHLHLVLSPLTIFTKDFELAKIRPLDFENEEFGALQLKDLSMHTALGAFTCVECGRCYDHCPARSTGKVLDPKQIMLDLRDGLLKDPEQAIIGDTLSADAIWQCTTCGACTYQCPVGIDQVVPILEARRGLVAEGTVPHTFNTFFGNLERLKNPWGHPTPNAHKFLADNAFPAYNGQEWLYWMGCVGRFDLQYRDVALAFKQILDSAGVSYGVLKDEQCTGDAARRAGNEYLFTELATSNVELLKNAGVKKIVATCPHCIRTLSEYTDFGLDSDIEIIHHSQLILDLVGAGKLNLDTNSDAAKTVYHDPCYLSRYGTKGDITNPRQLLATTNGEAPIEPTRTKEQSFCCGAGGAMIFAEETEGKRINHERTEELIATGAEKIAISCPFCQIMIRDATADLGKSEEVKVEDIAQIVAAQL
jgi:Fe-S oxidoreductase